MSVSDLARTLPSVWRWELTTPRRLYRLVAAEAVLVTLFAFLGLFWALDAPNVIKPDSWMTFLGGREILAHGIPHHDAMAVWTQGHRVIDQQWLAQVAFWEIWRLGGIKLAVGVVVALLLAATLVAVAVARRRGASEWSILMFAILPLFDITSLLRAQVFSQLLFVVLLALLAAESRSPSRRVALAFPVLVLWANLHGAVLVGAALTALLGLFELHRRRWRRGALLVVAPWLCLLATPYGAATAAYYPPLIHNPAMHAFEGEWQAPIFPSAMGFALFVIAALAIALVVKRRRDLTGFELGALGFTLVGALLAERSIPWFAYACLMLLPPLFERAWVKRRVELRAATGFAVASVATVLALAGLVAVASRPTAELTTAFPPGAAAAVTKVLRDDPRARVFATYQYPDWLLFVSPVTRGRVAYDGRFELLSQRQMFSLVDYDDETGVGWERPADGYRLLVVNPQSERSIARTYDRRPGLRVLFRSENAVVYDRGPSADS
jgi:hypothetical protein